MKKLICLVLYFVCYTTYGQTPQFIDSILANKIIRVPVYNRSKVGNETLLLKMNFAESSFVDTTGIYRLQNAQILSVDLLFTDYPTNLNLLPLNRKRLLSLANLLPAAMQDSYTSWQIIRQMEGRDKLSAEPMFHGFVINYRSSETIVSKIKEINLIKSVTPTITSLPAELPPSEKVNNWAIIHGGGLPPQQPIMYNRVLKKIDINKQLLQKAQNIKDTIVGLTYQEARDTKVMSEFGKRLFKDKDSIYFLLSPKLENKTKIQLPTIAYLEDSSVLKTLKRNRFKKMLIVADVTASMSPYVAQVFAWINSEAEKSNVQYVVCFNDGDGMDNNNKKIGNTGGIYGQSYKDAVQLSELIISTMKKCQANDIQENDCEAIIKGINLCSECDDVVLLADSWAPVRDIKLVTAIKKPVKVIACGNRYGIRTEYIEIALKTNGSLHFMNNDVVDLSPLKFGKEVEINNKLYGFKNGKVVEVVR
ncbi:MAG: hypothetical protein H7068_02395 [Pedobacter sp.]|nr:hypothetical protein [Chitinophagaceae bacterium]